MSQSDHSKQRLGLGDRDSIRQQNRDRRVADKRELSRIRRNPDAADEALWAIHRADICLRSSY